jgi:hypothetical protein
MTRARRRAVTRPEVGRAIAASRPPSRESPARQTAAVRASSQCERAIPPLDEHSRVEHALLAVHVGYEAH